MRKLSSVTQVLVGFSEKIIQRHTSTGSHDAVQEIIQYLHESDMKNVVPKKLDDFDKIVVSMVCTSFNPAGKHLRDCSVIVVDRYGYLRLEMEKDHLNLVQHSQIRTDECRAIGDISDSLK